jgi:hypothetical protein
MKQLKYELNKWANNATAPRGMFLRWGLVAGASVAAAGCGGSSAGDIARAVFCNEGLTKGLLTIGLNLGGIGLDFTSNTSGTLTDTSNDGLKNFLNSTLQTAGVAADAVRVASVESVKDGDSVRFLKLDGNYSPLFGVAASLFKQAFSGQSTSGGGGLFNFLYESFAVAATKIDFEPVGLPFWQDFLLLF